MLKKLYLFIILYHIFLKKTYASYYEAFTTLLSVSVLARENLKIESEFMAKIK